MNKTVQTDEWYEDLAARRLNYGEDETQVRAELERTLCPHPSRALAAAKILLRLTAMNDATCKAMGKSDT